MTLSESAEPAPTWNVRAEPSKTCWPENCVRVPIESSSWSSSSISACSATPSDVAVLAADTASSRMRCRIEWTSFSAPSAVWTSETPSWALRTAWLVPRISARRPSDFTSPAASSAARLMR